MKQRRVNYSFNYGTSNMEIGNIKWENDTKRRGMQKAKEAAEMETIEEAYI